MKIKKSKLFFSLMGLTALFLTASFTLTSCSSNLKKLVEKSKLNNGSTDLFTFDDDFTPEWKSLSSLFGNGGVISRALESSVGQNEMLTFISGAIAFKIITTKLPQKDYKGNDSRHKLAFDKFKKDAKKEYDELVKNYKKNHKDAWQLKIQQEVLDPVGGTWESYGYNKLFSWATGYLNGLIFNKLFLGLFDNKDNLVHTPTQLNVFNILNKTSGTNNKDKITYKFSPKTIHDKKTEAENVIFAQLQQLVFDEWIQFENPFVVNMSLWKYGAPTDGISSVYTHASDTTTSTDPDGNETTTTNGGSYEYPYFNTKSSNTDPSTVERFNNFLSAAKTNSNFLIDVPTKSGAPRTKNTLGLKNIPEEFTEDASTFILAKNSSIYKDLYIEFAAGSMYLYGQTINDNLKTSFKGNQFTDQKTKLQKKIKALSSGQSNIIEEFVFENNTGGSNTLDNKIKLDKSLVDEILNKDGEFAKARGKDLTLIDSFLVEDSQLNDFMLLRDQAGVHAISIDGDKYIKGTGSGTDKSYQAAKKRSGDVIVYHHFNKKMGYGTFDVNLLSEISGFFNANSSYILIKYAQQDEELKKIIFGDNTKAANKTIDWINSLLNYYYATKYFARIDEFNRLMFSQKSKYSYNYGEEVLEKGAFENGFAAPWMFPKTTIDLTKLNFLAYDFGGLATGLINEWSDVSKLKDDFVDKTIDLFISEQNDGKNYGSLKDNKDFNSLGKYSQFIYTNNTFINRVLLAYLNTDAEAKLLKKHITSTKMGEIRDHIKTQEKIDLQLFEKTLNNFMFNIPISTPDVDKWEYYDIFSLTRNPKPLANQKFDVDSLFRFRNTKSLYSFIINDQLDSKIIDANLIYLTMEFLIKDNFKEFINYLKDNVRMGIESYIVWAGSYNYLYDQKINPSPPVPFATEKSISDLLDVKNLKQNLNNSFSTDYSYSSNTKPSTGSSNITTNFGSDALFSENENYYTVVAGMNGFYGLQTAISNSLPPTIANEIFTNPGNNTLDGKGVLYSFKSRDNLKKIIDEFTSIIDLDNFAKTISEKTKTFDASKILQNNLEFKQKKEIFKDAINDTNQIKEVYFQKRDYEIGDYVSSNSSTTGSYTTIIDMDNTNVKHGAFGIPLTNEDITSIGELKKKIEDALKTRPTNGSPYKDLKNEVEDVITHLLYKAATNSMFQSKALEFWFPKGSKFKVKTVSDIRLYNELGNVWLEEWKIL